MIKGPGAVLSRVKNSHGAPQPAIGPGAREGRPAVAGTAAPDQAASGAFPRGQQPGAAPAARPASSPRALKNWRVRSRLLLLVIIPTVTAVAAGGVFIASSAESAVVNQRVLTLANLSGKAAGLVHALQQEREDSVRYIVLGNTGGGGGGAGPPRGPPPPRARRQPATGRAGPAVRCWS
jgi:hypothetical protein